MAETKLTKKEITDLQARLVEERGELQTQLATLEEDTFATTQSEMSGDVGLDDESADAGTATFEREKDLSILDRIDAQLADVARAEKRLAAGTYGTCEACGRPIDEDRLRARPAARFCLDDQHLAERAIA